MTKLEWFAQLDALLAEQDGMLQTSQAVARGIVKPIFYEISDLTANNFAK